MRITDLLKKEGIELNGPSASKKATIDKMVELMAATGNLNDPEGYKAAVTKREEEGTTGIGDGIAIPHGKTAAVDHAGLACMVCKDGTEYDAMDGKPVNLIFAIAVPDNSDNTHLELLSRLSMMLMDAKFRDKLIHCDDKDEFLKIIDEKETEKFGAEESEAKEAAKPEPAPEKPAKSLRITDLLKKESIELNGPSASKPETIAKMVELMAATGNLNDPEGYKAAVTKREEEGTTGIGDGIAIPHGKTAAVDHAGLACMVCKDGTEYDAMDGKPVNLIFAIAVPDNSDNTHLELLSRLSMMLMDPEFRQKLIDCTDKDEFLKIIDEKETEKFGAEEEQEAVVAETEAAAEKTDDTPAADNLGPEVVAVTACPTGIAHTYMAAESLEEKAKQMGVRIKVETNGSGGAKNVLTAEEIAGAKGVIIAADKQVAMARFDGKHLIATKVADGISKPEELINDALSQKGAIYHADGAGGAEDDDADSGETESAGRKIYKDLMNGVSHMLPFVIGGGIMMALSFLLDAGNAGSNFGNGTWYASFFNQVGNGAFAFMLPVLAGYIAMSIADRPGLAVGFVGGWLAKEGIVFGMYKGHFALLYSGLDGVTLVSAGFLGAMAAGFIAGYLVKWLEKICSHMPESLEGIKPMLIYPFFGILLIGIIMCLINVPLAALNHALYKGLESLGTGSIVVGLICGGMMAIDMGGPFNKAAYLFGTGMLASGNYSIMASVMIGGMTPPLGIALATTFFKNRFTKRERQSGISCYVMGLSFVTEGAIPFAASDPGHVIPSCVVGSALAGALSMAFKCTLRAPHGGIFVFPVVGNWPMYLVSLLIGSFVTMALLAILKKPLPASESGLE